jgi:NAD(P)-dependent dehydrogenase (short-subunit alcohol dehydrogenase family)
MNSLKGMIFLVSGCTSGIGRSTCESLLNLDANVYGLGRDKNKISDLIESFPINFHFISIDLTNKNGLKIIFDDLSKKNILLDGMVLSAGKEETIPLVAYKPSKIDSILDINVSVPIEMMRLFSRKKNCNQNSSVVIISSVMSVLGQPGKVGYCASKAALIGAVKAAALEFSTRKIRINAVSPGVVQTPMTEKLFNQLSQENINRIKSMHPLGLGSTKNIVDLIEFLLSDRSMWITGQNIIIDGGYSIQ